MKQICQVVLTILVVSLLTNSVLYGQEKKGGVLDRLSEAELKSRISKRAAERITDLGQYISVIGDKTKPNDLKSRMVNAAVQLFKDESAVVEVSSLNRTVPRSYKIREYLNRLRILEYDKVNIEWYKVIYVSDLKRDPDGNYRGVIRVYQRFQGSNYDAEGSLKLLYEDNTTKDIEFIAEVGRVSYGDHEKEYFNIKLLDLRVDDTF
ncbi:MAG: hypothetical protein RIC19_02845 [Phaeodactylibacter sp.]|uniref:hypothetical protein n=1 Tax=Phaeodactylibacter sp. TaxID=1940289 RepID=UPI0032EBBFDE